MVNNSMINLKKIKYPVSNFPIVVIDDFLKINTCKKIGKSILHQKNFDDQVMGGRNRINKGSDNFKKFLDAFSLFIYSPKIFL